MDELTIGGRIRAFRERDGLTQHEVGDCLGLNASAISRIESAARGVSAFELGLLSQSFGWDPRDLLGIERPVAKVALAARLRSIDGCVEHAAARVVDLLEIDALLDEIGLPEVASGLQFQRPVQAPPSGVEAREQGETAASAVREHFGIHGAIIDLYAFAEDSLGIDVVTEPLEGDCDGIVAIGEHVAFAVIDNSTETHVRQRFTLAHECGHAILGDIPDGVRVDDRGLSDLVEERASWFAAALLMPADDLNEVVGAIPTAHLLTLAMLKFQVSWSALKKRCEALNIVVAPELLELTGRQIFDLAGRSSDHDLIDTANRTKHRRMPARLARRVRDAHQESRIGDAVVGAAYGITGSELSELLSSYTT